MRPEDDRGSEVDVRARRAARDARRVVSRLTPHAHADLERFERARLRRRRNERLKAMAVAAAAAVVAIYAVTRILPQKVETPSEPLPPHERGSILFGRSGSGFEQRSLYAVAPDGTHERRLPITYTDCGEWSPDGAMLHVTASEYPGAPLRPATVRPDGSGFSILDTGIPRDLNLGCGDWSPDGSRLALEGFGASTSIDGVYTIDAGDGSHLTRLTHGQDVVPQWSPDGSAIVFQRTAGQGAPHPGVPCLFVVAADGSGLRRITPWGMALSAGSWSPDGRIVFVGPNDRLWTVHADGSGLLRMPVALNGIPYQPRWSPDGEQIVLGIKIGGQTDIYSVAADGSLTRVTHTPDADEWWPDWGS